MSTIAEYCVIMVWMLNYLSDSSQVLSMQNLWCAGYAAAAKHADAIIQLVEIMQHSGLPCFTSGRKAVDGLKRRFTLREDAISSLLDASVDAWTTRQYDYYQRVLNGIL